MNGRRRVAVRFETTLQGVVEVVVAEGETIEQAVTRKLRSADLDLSTPLRVVIKAAVERP